MGEMSYSLCTDIMSNLELSESDSSYAYNIPLRLY